MGSVASATIATEGARLHCEPRGDGPPLLIVQGGIAEAFLTVTPGRD